MAELKAERDVANRKVESLQMTLAALKDDHERLKGSEASLRTARANLKDREEKLRAMSKQLEAARCVPKQALQHFSLGICEGKQKWRVASMRQLHGPQIPWLCTAPLLTQTFQPSFLWPYVTQGACKVEVR